MTLWTAIVLACAATYLTKLAGYAVPARWLQNPRMTRVAGAITVALLSALTVMNTFAAGTALVIDARLAALGVAALALWLWTRGEAGPGAGAELIPRLICVICRFCAGRSRRPGSSGGLPNCAGSRAGRGQRDCRWHG